MIASWRSSQRVIRARDAVLAGNEQGLAIELFGESAGESRGQVRCSEESGAAFAQGVAVAFHVHARRPRVSDDNAFTESLFRTAKYRPEFSAHGLCRFALMGRLTKSNDH